MDLVFNPQGIQEAPCVSRRDRSLQRYTTVENLDDFDYRSPQPLVKDWFPTVQTTDTRRTDLMDLSVTPDEVRNKIVYRTVLQNSLASTAKRNKCTRSHYGPQYYRRGYYNEELADLLMDQSGTLAYIGTEGYKGPNVSERRSCKKTPSQIRAISAKEVFKISGPPEFTKRPYSATRSSYVSPGTLKTHVHKFREQVRVDHYHTGVFNFSPATGEQQWSCCGSSVHSDPGCMKKVSYPNKVHYDNLPY